MESGTSIGLQYIEVISFTTYTQAFLSLRYVQLVHELNYVLTHITDHSLMTSSHLEISTSQNDKSATNYHFYVKYYYVGTVNGPTSIRLFFFNQLDYVALG